MWHLSIRKLRQYLDRKLDKQRRRNELQDSQWYNLKEGAQRIIQWIKDFTADQDAVNIEDAHRIQELEKECAHLGSLIDTGVEDRIVGDNMLEERIEALESLLGIERDEEELSPSSRYSAPAQGLVRFTLLEQEVERMKRQFEAQALELKALRAQVNTQPSGQITQSYEVNEEVDRARSSTKKRKVMDFNDRQGKPNNGGVPTTVTSPGVYTYQYKLYIEQQDCLAPIGSGLLVDAWAQQCDIWSRTDPNWQNYKISHTCLNSMLWFRFENVMETPEALSFASTQVASSSQRPSISSPSTLVNDDLKSAVQDP
ncbi:hypothetical protein KCU91_g23, partial [Aureobasidium melanogenum]